MVSAPALDPQASLVTLAWGQALCGMADLMIPPGCPPLLGRAGPPNHPAASRTRGPRWFPLTCPTGGSPEASWTLAAEAVDAVCAGPAILTWVGSTLIHI